MARKSAFEKAFGSLVEHLRRRPEDRARTRQLAQRAQKSVAKRPVTLEAGLVFRPEEPDNMLESRMHARGVAKVEVSAGASMEEVLALGRALATDEGDFPQSPPVEVSMVVHVTPGERDGVVVHPETPREPFRWVAPDGDAHREPRLSDGSSAEFTRLAAAIRSGADRGAWTEALHAAQSLVQLAIQVPETKKGETAIAVRRLLTAPILHAFIDHAVRIPEERNRTIEVLEWVGRDAGEVVVDSLKESGSVGPKQFLLEVAPKIPDIHPMADALLHDPGWQKARIGALLVGALGDPVALPALFDRQEHPDARVRLAVVRAIGQLGTAAAVEPLKQRLSDRHPSVRVAAAEALAAAGGGGVVMILAGALSEEQDPAVRVAIIASLGRIDSSEVATVLTTMAMTRKSLLRRKGFGDEERLAAVEALGRHGSRAAVIALERLAEDADRTVGSAARRVLESAAPEPPT